MAHSLKERVLDPGQTLILSGMLADYLYFLIDGELVIEKSIEITGGNCWPKQHEVWQ